jgi:hypothetical protein
MWDANASNQAGYAPDVKEGIGGVHPEHRARLPREVPPGYTCSGMPGIDGKNSEYDDQFTWKKMEVRTIYGECLTCSFDHSYDMN